MTVMNRTTRRALPAVVVSLALTSGLAAAASFGTHDHEAAPVRTVQLTADKAPVTPPTTAARTAEPTTPAAGTPTEGSAPATKAPLSTPAAPSSDRSPGDPRAACATSVGGYRPATEAELRTAVTGAWLLCQPPSVFGTGEAGMEIGSDGRWSKLVPKSNGVLERTQGWGNEGAWESVDTSLMNGPGSFQLNLRVDGDQGTVIALPTFGDGSQASAVTKLELVTEGVVADYVPVPAGATIVPAPAGPPPVPADRCDTRTDPTFSPATQAELDAAIVGDWLLCGDTSVFGTRDAGLRITAGGRWNKLERRADGSLVAASGPDDAGAWQSVDVSAMNGRPLFQLNLVLDSGSAVFTIPAFAVHGKHVSKVRLDNSGVFVADYVPLPAGARVAAA
jgi:hypothetical protein